jgi:N-acyl-D-amino-acid deacylase
MSFDTIIKNGTVVDGSGLPKRVADVGIRDGIITDIGRLSGARRVLDADGLVVMPGIIDAHTHYDPQLTFEPFATSSCFHGVTSVVGGNCGYSIAPVRPADRDWVTKLFAKVEGMSPRVLGEGLPWDWETFPSLLETLDTRLGINAAVYVGHSALRRYVMGEAASERGATADEVAAMQGLVREAMRAGWGSLRHTRRRTSTRAAARCRRATRTSTRSWRWPPRRGRAARARSASSRGRRSRATTPRTARAS